MDSREGLEALFEYATEGILVADDAGNIVKINPATEKMFGYLKGELNGKKVELLIPSRYNNNHVHHREKYFHHPQPRSMGEGRDLFGKRKDNTEFPVEISLSPYKTDTGIFVIAFIVDITVRKRAEMTHKQQSMELERLASELKQYNKDLERNVRERTMVLEEAIAELNKTKEELNEAVIRERELNELKSRFVSMVSHEFRTPLTTILSSLMLVTRYLESNDQEKQKRHIERIRSSVNGLTDILNDVLSISKLEEGKVSVTPEIFHISELALEVIRDMQGLAQQQQIDYKHHGETTVTLDKKLVKHILFNLVSNAIKFSGSSGIIEIVSDVRNGCVGLVVKDNGIGIPVEDQEHLFERFFRAKNAANIQGTGLGLHIVAKYVELMNGAIECNSVLDVGTVFTITLPNQL